MSSGRSRCSRAACRQPWVSREEWARNDGACDPCAALPQAEYHSSMSNDEVQRGFLGLDDGPAQLGGAMMMTMKPWKQALLGAGMALGYLLLLFGTGEVSARLWPRRGKKQ